MLDGGLQVEAGALYALDRLHAREPEYRRRLVAVELPTSFRPEKSDLASMVLPHASAYSTPRDVKPGESFREFSAAHPHGFRGAYADYIDYMTAIALGGVIGEAADAVALRDGFMARHPDDPLGLEVVSVTLRAVRAEYYEREGHVRPSGRRAARRQGRGERALRRERHRVVANAPRRQGGVLRRGHERAASHDQAA